MKATYWRHSGFSVETENATLLFDYIGGGFVRGEKPVIAFVSHDHSDHLMPGIEKLGDHLVRGMTEGQQTDILGAHVRACGSTDEGVSFLVRADGMNIFHAGDLNFWHWKDESTPEEIAAARRDFMRVIEDIKGASIDLAFFPVDPRMGADYDEGARIFMAEIKPRVMIPMHWWENAAAARAFAAQYANVRALTVPGESIEIL
jgi:L-ascorbate metabolism protein UlaG (beta-lactamase superfamily)